MTNLLWGGRFDGKVDPLAHQLNQSLSVDQRMWREDVAGSVAWAGALGAAGVVTTEEADRLQTGLRQVQTEFEAGSFAFAPGDEDIHTAVERRLTEVIGPLGGKLHTGRSRNDQVATDFRLWCRSAIDGITGFTRQLQTALVLQAEAHVSTLLPGYTHVQRAQPITFGHWCLAHFWALERDLDRWHATQTRLNVMPLGSAALAGTAYPIDRSALAGALGFARASENSLDAISDRDFAAEFLFDAALTGTHLSRLAEALILYSSSEFGFVTMADAYSTGSSIMPQKKNPDMLELARGKAGTLLGALTGLLSTLKGLPSAYDKDLQEDKGGVFAAFDVLATMLPVVAGCVATLTVNIDRMRAALDPMLLATELADYLVRKGVPFREAHHVVGAAVRLVENGRAAGTPGLQKLSDLTLEHLRDLHAAFEADVVTVWDFDAAVARRTASGGTSPDNVRAQIAAARQILDAAAREDKR
ncbi:MAG: argininosuccinate lyase [Anaerolineales bacterium]|nr:argininosuccinate lyase [Anaerolineales bacterium]